MLYDAIRLLGIGPFYDERDCCREIDILVSLTVCNVAFTGDASLWKISHENMFEDLLMMLNEYIGLVLVECGPKPTLFVSILIISCSSILHFLQGKFVLVLIDKPG